MKIIQAVVAATIGSLLVATLSAQPTTHKIDELIERYFEQGKFHGAILVADRGRVKYTKGFGMANIEWAIPNRPDTKFRIASITKQFTAALVLKLVDEGKIRLDGKVTDYLPDYRRDTGDKVTIHHLLNHTSGIPSYSNAAQSQDTPLDFVNKYVSGDLEFEPGAKFKYNNGGYSILGAIIERVTGKPYDLVVVEKIFQPLGMVNSGFEHRRSLIPKRAAGYEKTRNGFLNAPYIDMEIPYAAGSLYSTVEDLFKWDQAMSGAKVLSSESRRLMFTPGLSEYGYGVRISEQPVGRSDAKLRVAWHGGGINGFNSLLSRAIDKRQTVIILDNGSLGRYHAAITNSIFAILNGQRADLPRRSVAEHLSRLASENVSSAISEYRRLRTTDATTFDFSESELITLGSELLARKRTKEAIEIFKLNVEMFPRAASLYEILGDAYIADGQQGMALAAYKKAVELDSGNANAILAIKRLENTTAKIDSSGFGLYVGEYQVAPRFVLTVTMEGDKLFAQGTGQAKMQLEPVSDTQFAMREVKANIEFKKGPDGKVTGLVLTQGSRSANAPKLK